LAVTRQQLRSANSTVAKRQTSVNPAKTVLIPSQWWLITGIAASLMFLAQGSGQQQRRVVQHQDEGNLGQNRIGMTVIREDNKIEGGHYFYQKFLRNIPITGSTEGSHITLTEPGGGRFHLHFVGDGSEGGRPLDFENSVGMDGTWTSPDNTRSYPGLPAWDTRSRRCGQWAPIQRSYQRE
jgi:hypothetical protein